MKVVSEEAETDDLVGSFSLDFAAAVGISGLPLLQEILLSLFIIISLSLWLLFHGGFLQFPFSKTKQTGYKHLALPALVLSKEQRQRIAKLLLPSSCMVEKTDSKRNGIDKQKETGVASADNAVGSPDSKTTSVTSKVPSEKAESDHDSKSRKESPEKLLDESDKESHEQGNDPKTGKDGEKALGKTRDSEALSIQDKYITPTLRKLESRMKRKLKYRRNRSRKQLKYDDTQQSREALLGKTPLLVFVNKKSGGQQGELLLYQLRALLHPWQVYDLKKGSGPEVGLKVFSKVPMFRILVAGGDGTIAWVLETLDRMNLDYRPPVAILPLGTGNDLARVLGWGSGLHVGQSSARPLISQLSEVGKAQLTLLDRWDVAFSNDKNSLRGRESSAKGSTVRESRVDQVSVFEQHVDTSLQTSVNMDVHSRKVMNNYLGVGVDAQIALNFHLKRERAPHLFTHRLLNKFWYASSGGQEILMQRFIDFATHVTLECDGRSVPLPVGCEGLIVLNIESYGGGVDLWCGKSDVSDGDDGEDKLGMRRSRSLSSNRALDKTFSSFEGSQSIEKKEKSYNDLHFEQMKRRLSKENVSEKFSIPSYQDKMLEVVGVSSSFQLGAAQVGLARPTRLCQGRHIRIRTKKSLPVQMDGEPSIMDPYQCIEISHRNQAHMLSMAHLVDEIDKSRVTADVIDWAFTSGVIDTKQRDVLLSEISRRIQEARVRSGSIDA
mmetsp:Transcript_19281/g.25128  ORF Transcript_19281/g.25128 Transcript_19281/m.25128 type:complete len:722 (-) Transcript_19281:24-2189(-)